MTNRIHLAAIVEREGRILLIRQTPRSPWELPGGPLLQRQADADAAIAEILETFGIRITDPEERFIETLYLPDGDGQIVFNLYGATDWSGEPEIPIGMGAGWYTFEEVETIDMREEVRTAVLVAFGLREAPDADARILQAMAGAATDPGAIQPPLGAVVESAPQPVGSEWAKPEEPAAAAVEQETIDADDEDGAMATESWEPAATEPEPVVLRIVPNSAEEAADALELRVEEAAHAASIDLAEAISIARDIFEDEDDPREQENPPPTVIGGNRLAPVAAVDSERRQKGLDVLGTLGKSDPAVGFERMKAQYPELAADIVDFALGEVWSGDTLTRRERSLLVVAMLSAMSGREGPLFSHVNGALNHGATPDEIVETLRMVAVYAGFPAALEAWGVMEDVFPLAPGRALGQVAMMSRLGIIAAGTMAAISAVHVYWAAGGSTGAELAVPEINGKPTLNPSPLASLVVALAMTTSAATVAVAAAQVSSAKRSRLPRQGAAILSLVFALRAMGDFKTVGFSKKVHGTRFATMDTRVYSPLCAFLSVLCGGGEMNAVLWDLDDTVLNTLPWRIVALSRAYESTVGGSIDAEALWRSHRGGTLEDLGKRLLGSDYLRFVTAYRDEYYGSHRPVRPFEGVTEALAALHDAGVPMAVVTSKISWGAIEELQEAGLLEYFAAVVGVDDTERNKPDPEPIFAALDRLLVDPSEDVYMVGDSPADMFAAKSAGCTAVAATWGTLDEELLRDAFPPIVVTTPLEIVALLRGKLAVEP